jgi:putative membrane protein
MTTFSTINKVKLIVSLLLAVVAVATTINPIYPNEQFLQHIGTLIISSVVLIDLKRNVLPVSVFLGVSIFILIHIIGARWIYSFVPYEDWGNMLFGWDLNGSRNHYDRIVHFSFGVLTLPYFHALCSQLKIKNIVKVLIAWAIVQSLSVFYEVFEWLLTLLFSSDAAENYNGQQGDIWDAQKDMALAMLGSTLSGLYILLFKKNKLKS